MAELVKVDVITVDDLLALSSVYDETKDSFNMHEHINVNKNVSVSINGDGKRITVEYFIEPKAIHGMNMLMVRMAGKLAKVGMAIKNVVMAIADLGSLKEEVKATFEEYFGAEDKEDTEGEEETGEILSDIENENIKADIAG